MINHEHNVLKYSNKNDELKGGGGGGGEKIGKGWARGGGGGGAGKMLTMADKGGREGPGPSHFWLT